MKTIGEYDQSWFERQTPLKLLLKGILVFVVLSGIVMAVGFACGWVKTGADVVGPKNVKAQWQFAYDYTEKLNAIGNNWCTATKAEEAETNPDNKSQRTTQRIAIEQLYSQRQAEYDARLRDAFRAKLVKPSDVPNRAPTLPETVQELGCLR